MLGQRYVRYSILYVLIHIHSLVFLFNWPFLELLQVGGLVVRDRTFRNKWSRFPQLDTIPVTQPTILRGEPQKITHRPYPYHITQHTVNKYNEVIA